VSASPHGYRLDELIKIIDERRLPQRRSDVVSPRYA
jgi:hypothetical protein